MYSDIISEKLKNNNKNVLNTEKILTDIIFREDGTIKINNWREKKLKNLELAASYFRIYGEAKLNKYLTVLQCAEWVDFRYENENDLQGKLHRAFFCKDRLCPTCNWRRTMKVFAQASAVMTEASNQGYKFIFLTLTVKNVKSDVLEQTIKDMAKGFSNLTKLKDFKSAIKGFFRALEITYNEDTDEYHPHYHCILAVKKSYFKSRFYLQQEDFTQMWQQVMKLDYTPIVHVEAFKAATKKELAKATAEAAKYTVKDSDYLIRDRRGNIDISKTDKVVHTLAESLFKKRLIGWGGILKDIHKKLNLDDAETGDLVLTGVEDESGASYIIKRYRWGVGVSGRMDYYLTDEKVES